MTTLGTAPTTRRSVRILAMAGFAVLLTSWSRVVGIPSDPIGVTLWIWLGTVAWNLEAPRTDHLGFLRDWWRPMLLVVVYWLLRGLADEIGVPVHQETPVRLDEWLGGGTAPTVTLQQAWCGRPCGRTMPPRWYDVVLTTVYASHFVTALTLAGVLWVRDRLEWARWMRRYLTMLFAGLAGYIAYPMAPPWMAARDGYLPQVARITGRGWSEIDLHRQTLVLFGMGNKVAAMPSLHAGIAFLVAFYGIWRLRSPYRWLLLLYPVTMSLALVYFAEHYVVDVLAGGLLAGLVMAGCARWERRPRGPGAASQEPVRPRTSGR